MHKNDAPWSTHLSWASEQLIPNDLACLDLLLIWFNLLKVILLYFSARIQAGLRFCHQNRFYPQGINHKGWLLVILGLTLQYNFHAVNLGLDADDGILQTGYTDL